MTRVTFILLILITILSGSCSSRKKRLEKSEIIPEKDLTDIIKDIYIANGLLNLPSIHSLYIPPDSLSTYKDVIGRYGYTKEAMDQTLKYYFIKKPKELVKIFDQALGTFSALDSRIEKELNLQQARALNLWKGNEQIHYPEASEKDSTAFRIIARPGVYLFTYLMTIYPDDNSIEPHLSAFYTNLDSAETGKKHWIRTLDYVKDGLPHRYTHNITITGRAFVIIKGCLYDYDDYPVDFIKHLSIEKISFTNTSARE